MKISKFSFYILIFFVFAIKSYSAPTLPDPGTRSTTTYTAINSDYGPRNFSGQEIYDTNPHRGVDYNIATGTKAYVVESGTITGIKLGANDSLVVAGNWRYIHMEDNSLILQGYSSKEDNPRYLEGIPADIIVFREIVDGSTIGIKGLSFQKFPDDLFYDQVSQSSVTVNTTVSKKDWIFVPKNITHPHLHLDYNGGTKNPLRYVTHKDDENPIIWPKYKYIDTNNQAQDFSNNILYNIGIKPVILQEGVDTLTDKDLNTAAIFVRPINISTYAPPMNKWIYEPATTQNNVNTTTGKGETIYKKDTTPGWVEIAISTAEGVYPVKDIVSVDFFKYHWNTLKSVSGLPKALINSDAEWKDGKYSIKMEAEDITGNKTIKEETKILNNFRPYAQKVTIKNKDTQETYYEAEWQLDGTSLKLNKTVNESLQFNSEYTISILFSENLSMAALNIEYYENSVELSSATENEKLFTGNFSTPNDSVYGARILKIESKDLANTDNLKVNTGVTEIDTELITRDADGYQCKRVGNSSNRSHVTSYPPTQQATEG
jgi:hypothetical protein